MPKRAFYIQHARRFAPSQNIAALEDTRSSLFFRKRDCQRRKRPQCDDDDGQVGHIDFDMMIIDRPALFLMKISTVY